jgi:hypothetical protein
LIEIIKKVFMKKSLLFILLFIFTISLYAQKDTVKVIGTLPMKDISKDAANISVSIYPVPVRENSFTIKTNRDVSLVRITNIIGQDVFRVQYSNPQQLIKIQKGGCIW